MPISTGDYFEHINDSLLKTTYYTFTPRPLVNNEFYTVDEELLSLIASTHKSLGILEGISLYMPNKETLRDIFLYKEAYHSHRIDYPASDYYSQLKIKCQMKDQSVQNILCAYEELASRTIAIETLEHIGCIAKHGAEPKENMSVRTNPAFLTKSISNIKQYVPTAPEHIKRALDDMIHYLKADMSDVLIKAAISHYQFEIIHPFDSHNGIIGRLLILHTLASQYRRAVDYVNISEHLYKAKNEYFDLLSSTQKSGGYLRWIRFLINCVLKAAQQGYTQIEKYQYITKHDEAKLNESELSVTPNTIAVFDYWKRNLLSDIRQASESLYLSFNTVERSVQILEDLEILKQCSTGQRKRQLVYSQLANLFTGDEYM